MVNLDRLPVKIRPFVERYWRHALAVVVGFALIVTVIWARSLGHGLTGNYQALGKTATRVDRTVDFNWGDGSPFSGWRQDEFSIVWTGYLYIPANGDYGIATRNDDGARLWLDDTLIVDDWWTHRAKINRATVRLLKGYHPVRLEYFEKKGSASIRLAWQLPGKKSWEVIPARFLLPDARRLPEGADVYGRQSADE